jgi:glycosyltransferase involved in cell wall biosynthesis
MAERGYKVYVITRKHNQKDIENACVNNAELESIEFLYYDSRALLPLLNLLKARFRYFYYYYWQWGAYKYALKKHQLLKFDLVHHVTWVQVRMPSFLWKLDIPLIFGPVGGGEKAPWRLWSALGLRQWVVDLLRTIWGLLSRFDPFVQQTMKNASKILVTSTDTLQYVPKNSRHKTKLQLAIAFERKHTLDEIRPLDSTKSSLRIIYVGRYLGWKGMALGLNAFALLAKQCPDATLTMVGSGPAEKSWRRLAYQLGIESNIEWINWMPHNKVIQMFRESDIMLFPSLHDSGGFVVLEALSEGLPVVCLGIGGPGIIVDSSCGININVQGKSRKEVETELSEALLQVASDKDFYKRLKIGAFKRVQKFNWDALIDSCYEDFG